MPKPTNQRVNRLRTNRSKINKLGNLKKNKPKSNINLSRTLQSTSKKGLDVSNVLESRKRNSKPSHFGGFKAKARAISLSIAVTMAGIFGGRAILKNRAQIEKERASIQQVISQERLVRNPSQWSEIAMIYGWNPATKNGLARIELIEKISNEVGVSPKRVLLTLEQNRIDSHQIWALRNRQERVSDPQRKEQIERVISVLTSAKSNPVLSREIEEELRQNRGSLNKLRKVSD